MVVLFVEKLLRLINYMIGKGFGGGLKKNKEVSSALKFTKHKSNFIFVDCGANIGLYTEELISHIGDRYEGYLFEPSKSNYINCQNRFNGNTSLSILNYGLSDNKGVSSLYSDFDGSGLASISNRRLDHFGIAFNQSEQISLILFDDFWEQKLEQKEIDLFKIDVEGHELSVLRGMARSISKIRVLAFEFGGANIDSRTFFQDFYYFFQSNNFRLYRITPFGPLKITEYSEHLEFFKTTNYIAVNNRFI